MERLNKSRLNPSQRAVACAKNFWQRIATNSRDSVTLHIDRANDPIHLRPSSVPLSPVEKIKIGEPQESHWKPTFLGLFNIHLLNTHPIASPKTSATNYPKSTSTETASEISSDQISSAQISSAQIRLAQISPNKTTPHKFKSNRMNSDEMKSNHSPSFLQKTLELLPITDRATRKSVNKHGLVIISLMGLGILATSLLKSSSAHSETAQDESISSQAYSSDEPRAAQQSIKNRLAPSMQQANVRQFHIVIEDLLTEFGFDVKNGQVLGLKNVAIRKTRVNESIPNSYEKYLEMLVSERIRTNSDTRLINCLTCSARTSSLVEGKLKITSPETNITQLRDAARMMGIENFIDVLLVYHSSHMILAIEIFNVETGEMQWTKTYNSENLRTKFQKLAVDYSQIAKSRSGEEYNPEFKYLFGLGAGGVSNVTGSTQDNSAVIFNLRATEKFNNRTNEFGLVASIYLTMAGIAKEYPTTGTSIGQDKVTTPETEKLTPTPFKKAVLVYASYGHNFLGSMEFYDDIRSGYQLGIGAFFSTGYLAPAIRGGWDFSFGRRFVVTPGILYILPSKILIGENFVKTSGGGTADVIFSYNF